jgi:serine/threonine-protein kinase
LPARAPGARIGLVQLEIGRDGEAGRLVEWAGERPLVIGRGRDVDVPLADPRLSRRHCQLELANGVVTVADLHSANGTFQNGVQIERSVLQLGDTITFGKSFLRLVPDTEAEKPAAAPAADEGGATKRTNIRTAPTDRERAAAAAAAGDATESGPAGAAPAAGPPAIDGYTGFAQVGKGSFGVVYRAKRTSDGSDVAIKVLPTGAEVKPELVARFLREIEAAGQLDHPNLVRVLGAGETDTFAYLVMEYCPGETLALRLLRGRMQPLPALQIARQLAGGLAHAFSRGFVHRDVKPENILLDDRGTPKLCDFGLVKSLGATTSKGLTRPGQGFGSVAYMPPEQVKNAVSADQRADVYSVGATLYHMLSGQRPYSGKVTKSLLRRVLEEMPEPILEFAPDVPPAAVRLVEKCLQKDPAARFQTPQELGEAIDAAVAQIGPALPTPAEPRAAERPPSGGARAISRDEEALDDFAQDIESDLAVHARLEAEAPPPEAPPPRPPMDATQPFERRPLSPRPALDATLPIARPALTPPPAPADPKEDTKKVAPPRPASGALDEGDTTKPLARRPGAEDGAAPPAAPPSPPPAARAGLIRRLVRAIFGGKA